jgi:hypothetical protein
MVEREDFWESDDEEESDEEVGVSQCPDCDLTYTQKQIDEYTVMPCNRCYKCFVGDCGKDNCECEFDDEKEAPVEVKKEKPKGEHTAEMKAYIKARMNYVMREEQEEYGINPNDGGKDFIFVRKNGWDPEEFDNLLCAVCDKSEKKLNTYSTNNYFEVGATLESSRNWERKPKMNEDGHDRHWIVGVFWSVNEEDPFEELYDEDEEVIESDDDEEDDE